MRPADLTSVERRALGQLDSEESLFFEHHNTLWNAKHERPLRPPIVSAQTERRTDGRPLTIRSFPIEYVLTEIRPHVGKILVTHTL
jgi:hypothetical protein